MKTNPTQDRLKELLNYDAQSGEFTWRVSRGTAKAGMQAGCVDAHEGYARIGIDGVSHLAHRLAWLYEFGVFPEDQIDHINGERHDNRLVNLRQATNNQNLQNMTKQQGKSSRFLGVSWCKSRNKWQAGIRLNGKSHNLGYFSTEEAAHAAYCKAKSEIHTFNQTPRYAGYAPKEAQC